MSNSIWFGNGYGVEFIVADTWTIVFNVITEKDTSLVEQTNVIVGTDSCHRDAELDEVAEDVVPGSEEPLRDFAIRARKEGISFAEGVIIEHKESLDLSNLLDGILGDGEYGDNTE